MRRPHAVSSRTSLLLVGLFLGPLACTDVAGPATATGLSFVTSPASTLAGHSVSPAIVVKVQDANGDVVTTATTAVTLSVAGSSAALFGTTTVSAINGVATFSDVSIRTAGTGYQLIATADNLSAATSSAFDILVGYPFKLGFITQPTTAFGRVVMTPAVRVAVQDWVGNTTTAGSFVVTMDLASGEPTAALGGKTATTVNGVASFESLSVDTPSSYTLRATAPSLVEAISAPFTITFGEATRLVFAPGPLRAKPGEHIAPSVEVRVEDAYGNRVPETSPSITVALGSNPAGGTLSGTTTRIATNGLASFSDLSIDKVGTGYTLTATSTGLATAHTSVFKVRDLLKFKTVSSGYFHSCGIATDDISYCWGVNGVGELGSPGGQSSEPIPVSGGHTFVSISAGRSHSCGLTAAGAAYCWGGNSFGQIGTGDLTNSDIPLLVSGGHVFAQVTAGYSHTCGVTTAGAGYCWGGNSLGDLGNGSTFSASTPVAVSGGHTFASISPGRLFTCGVTTSGAGYCWGDNSSGTLGNSTLENSPQPVAIPGGLAFTAISGGGFHACGLTTDGIGRCWGSNGTGALGTGNFISTVSPAPVAGGLSFATISAGNRHSCGVTTTGAGYCWGENGGFLGDGGTANSSTPSPTAGGLVFTTISAGRFHSCGVTTSSEAYCWGDNSGGRLGDGTMTTRLVPTLVR